MTNLSLILIVASLFHVATAFSLDEHAAMLLSTANTEEERDHIRETLKSLKAAEADQPTEDEKKKDKADKDALIGGDLKNICTAGKESANMSYKEYLQAFAEGPCSPTVILPGVGGSKLIAQIDCEKLKNGDPDLFKTCGWTECSSSKTQTSDSKSPFEEYKIWIAPLGSRMDIFNPINSETRNSCFTGIFGVRAIDNNGIFLKNAPGVKIYPLGDTEPSRKLGESSCAADAIRNLFPLAETVKLSQMEYFGPMLEVLENAGYRHGITLQALPYDWRKSYESNRLKDRFEKVIQKLFEVANKKVSIIAHSMGNYQVAANIWKMSQENRDKLIARYISIAPPFLGSARASMHPLTSEIALGADAKFLKLGITAKMFMKTLGNAMSDYELMVKRFFNNHRNESWMKAALMRMKEERERKEITKGTIMDLFPDWKSECIKEVRRRLSNCFTGIYEMWDIGTVDGKEFNPTTAKQLFETYSYNEHASQIYDYVSARKFNSMDNLGVQTNIIYSNILKTISRVIIDKDPRSQTLKGEFYEPDLVNYELGDGTVSTTSAIMPGIKWASEFDAKQRDAKPVKLIELCSQQSNDKQSIFDNITESGERVVQNNGYLGIKCKCIENSRKGTGSKCEHTGMVSDFGVIEFVARSLVDGSKGKISQKYISMTEEQIKLQTDSCSIFFDSKK